MNHIEQEYEELVKHYETHSRKSANKGVQKVLQLMLDNPKKVWWWSYEFVGKVNSKGDFLSHRSPARASDLAIHCQELVEDRKIGNLSVYRLKVENLDKIKEFLK